MSSDSHLIVKWTVALDGTSSVTSVGEHSKMWINGCTNGNRCIGVYCALVVYRPVFFGKAAARLIVLESQNQLAD